MKLVGFVGTGKMGGALASAVIKKVGGDKVMLADAQIEKAKAIADEYGCDFGSSNDVVKSCKFAFLGVKPQVMQAVADSIKADISPDTILVSMAAGISIERIENMFGKRPVIRIMPNTPVSVGEGMILYCSGGVSSAQTDGFLQLMSKAGKLCGLDEKLIDAGSAVSGCGPAFAFMFIEALADGGVQCGLPRDKATLLAAQTLLGASSMVLQSGVHPEALKDAVCSPGGTTIEGVHALENGGFRASSAEAVIAAYKRTLELGK